MKHFAWNSEKNEQLIRERGISFERVLYHVEREGFLDVVKHPNPLKCPDQYMFIVNVENYAYLVPFVGNETEFFLETIIPSRKATKKYIEVSDE